MTNFPVEEKFLKLLEEKVPQIISILESENPSESEIKSMTDLLHASEIAYLIQYLEQDDREKFINLIRPFFNPEIFFFVDRQIKNEIISILSDKEIAGILNLMESDDSLDVLSDLDKEKQCSILASVEKEVRKNLEKGLLYPEDSAARLMQQEVLSLCQTWTVRKSLEYIAKEDNLPQNFYDIFVIDKDNKPVGTVPLSKLVKSDKNKLLQDIMIAKAHIIPWNMEESDAAFLFRSYDLMSAPVTDANGAIIGMITIDDIVDIIEEKAEEDIMHMGGITGSDFYAPVLRTSFVRVQWLIIAFIDAMLSSIVIDQFETTFKGRVALTVLLPIAAAMGGNSGMQSLTMTVRAIATREVSSINAMRTITKEIAVAITNGIVFAFILGIIGFIWFSNLTLAIVLGGSVIFSMVWAGFAGTFFPIFIEKMGYDPALSAAPLLSVTTDICGFTFFLGLAKLLM